MHYWLTKDRKAGAVSKESISFWIHEFGGIGFFSFSIFLFLFAEGIKFLSDAWVSFWVDRTIPNFTQGSYALVYGLLCIGIILFSVIRGICFSYGGLEAAFGIHANALSVVLRANGRHGGTMKKKWTGGSC